MPGATMHENGGSKADEVLWVVTDDELETPTKKSGVEQLERYTNVGITRNGTSLLSEA